VTTELEYVASFDQVDKSKFPAGVQKGIQKLVALSTEDKQEFLNTLPKLGAGPTEDGTENERLMVLLMGAWEIPKVASVSVGLALAAGGDHGITMGIMMKETLCGQIEFFLSGSVAAKPELRADDFGVTAQGWLKLKGSPDGQYLLHGKGDIQPTEVSIEGDVDLLSAMSPVLHVQGKGRASLSDTTGLKVTGGVDVDFFGVSEKTEFELHNLQVAIKLSKTGSLQSDTIALIKRQADTVLGRHVKALNKRLKEIDSQWAGKAMHAPEYLRIEAELISIGVIKTGEYLVSWVAAGVVWDVNQINKYLGTKNLFEIHEVDLSIGVSDKLSANAGIKISGKYKSNSIAYTIQAALNSPTIIVSKLAHALAPSIF
jgi:hypothetical protein